MKDLNLIELTNLEKKVRKERSPEWGEFNNRARKDHRTSRTEWIWEDNTDQVIKWVVTANVR